MIYRLVRMRNDSVHQFLHRNRFSQHPYPCLILMSILDTTTLYHVHLLKHCTYACHKIMYELLLHVHVHVHTYRAISIDNLYEHKNCIIIHPCTTCIPGFQCAEADGKSAWSHQSWCRRQMLYKWTAHNIIICMRIVIILYVILRFIREFQVTSCNHKHCSWKNYRGIQNWGVPYTRTCILAHGLV